jgi:protein-disulfide isomerase
MLRFSAFLLLLFSLSMMSVAQRPSDVLATARGRTIKLSDLSAETIAAVTDAPTKRMGVRKALFDRFVYERLITLEAGAQKTTAEKIESAELLKVQDPTAAQIKAVYDANRERLGGATLEEARKQIVAFLRSDDEQKALNRLAARLRVKHKYVDGKDVNAAGLAPTDTIATIAGRAIAAKEFEDYARVEMHEFDESIADRVLADIQNTLINALVSDKAAAEKIAPNELIAREITDKLKDFSPEERNAVEQAFAARLMSEFEAKILYKRPAPLVQAISVDDDPASGPADAPVTLVMFSDFQCPACAATHPVIKRIIADYPNKIRFVVRDFPLENIHENALGAALAANAAHAQGKFFEYSELLYANQSALDDASLKRYATQLGLNLQKFELDSKAAKAAAEVRKDKAAGASYGVNGTPTIFVNGVKVRGISEGDIRAAVARALAK